LKSIILNPAGHAATLGNSVTATRWAAIIGKLGHDVFITSEWNGEPCDILIALHARRSYPSIDRFSRACPDKPLIVALTGTDLYGDLPDNAEVQRSLKLATRVVALQHNAPDLLGNEVRKKTSIIYQSAAPPVRQPIRPEGYFQVCVLSHLREVKDPLRTAFASRLLPQQSTIQIIHAGRELDPELAELARREEQNNFRYRWIGEQSHESAMELLSASHLYVISSRMEGGANAIAEAVVCGVPVLCSDIPGNVGMLDPDYPGYFGIGNTEELARMLSRAETDHEFLSQLRENTRSFQDRFSPEHEIGSWETLLSHV
jgi:putative glycosyltransferase (TIGR04348 family)